MTISSTLPAHHVTVGRVLRSEAIKLRSLRSSWAALAAAALALLATAVGVAVSVSTASEVGPELAAPEAPLQGFLVAQLVLGVLGVLAVSSEYGTGTIRSTFAAVPRRLLVLGAKATVFGTVALVTMTATAFAAFLGAQAILAGDEHTASLGDPGVLRAIAGTGAYLAVVGLLGVALGWIVRSSAGAIGALTGLLLALPSLALLLPSGLESAIAKFLPTNAGQALMTSSPDGDLLTPGAGLAVLVLWLAGGLLAADVLVRRRDV